MGDRPQADQNHFTIQIPIIYYRFIYIYLTTCIHEIGFTSLCTSSMLTIITTRRYASAVYAVVVCLSVYVRPSQSQAGIVPNG